MPRKETYLLFSLEELRSLVERKENVEFKSFVFDGHNFKGEVKPYGEK